MAISTWLLPAVTSPSASIEQRQHVGQRLRVDGDLHDLRAGGSHRRGPLRQIVGHRSECMERQDDAAAAPGADQIGCESRASLDVDELGTGRNGRFEQTPPLLF